MYKAVLNFLRGQVLVHIESGCPERVVNLCAGAEVPFWDVRWLSPVELTLRTTRRGLTQVRQAARQVGAAATVRREQGAPLLARRLRRRYVLLAGLLLTVLLVLEGNFTIWEFRVSGNETVPDEVILRALEDYGITIGTRSLDIDQKDMRSHVLLELKDVVWLAVNVKGCVAQVQVVERVRGQAVVEDRLTNVGPVSGPGHPGGGPGRPGHGAARSHRYPGAAADLRGGGPGQRGSPVAARHGPGVGPDLVRADGAGSPDSVGEGRPGLLPDPVCPGYRQKTDKILWKG